MSLDYALSNISSIPSLPVVLVLLHPASQKLYSRLSWLYTRLGSDISFFTLCDDTFLLPSGVLPFIYTLPVLSSRRRSCRIDLTSSAVWVFL